MADYSASGPVLLDPATRHTLGDGTEVMFPFPNSMVPQSRLQPDGLFSWRLASPWPSAPGVLPPSPGAGNTATQTFTFQFTAASRYQDLGVVNILVNFCTAGQPILCIWATTPATDTRGRCR